MRLVDSSCSMSCRKLRCTYWISPTSQAVPLGSDGIELSVGRGCGRWAQLEYDGLMGLYRKLVVPWLCDLAMRNTRLTAHREATVAAAAGRVLEIGAGSGLNLPLYPPAVHEVVELEPDPALVRMARSQSSGSPREVSFLQASAEHIPLADHSVDTVVSTWTMCSIPDVRRALAEVRRVLKPGGRLLFVEHGRAPEERIRRWQHRLDPLWTRLSGGCHLDRPIATLIEESGFEVERLQSGYMQGPKLVTFLYEGAAHAR